MLGLLGVVTAVALVDSLNPGTIAPALYFALSSRPTHAVAGFLAGFFAVNLVGGILLLLAGGALLDALPHLSRHATHLLELVLGCAALVGGAFVLAARRRLNARFHGAEAGGGRAAPIAGAVIAGIELPTAIPYLGTIAVLAESDASVVAQVALLVLFNVVFLAPVVAILALTTLDSAEKRIEGLRTWLNAHGATVVGVILLVVGTVLVVVGARGLTGF
jgi:cytochrome c biogenesis protein CcdA